MQAKLSDPGEVGIDAERLRRLPEAIARDVRAGRYDGAVIAVARHGKLVLHEAVGYAHRDTERPARTDDWFAILSLTKALTNVLVLNRFERGDLQLTSPIVDFLPEFGMLGKKRVTVAQLLGHMGGLGGMPMASPEIWPNLEAAAAAVCAGPPQGQPGATVSYSGLSAHVILGEVLRRLDGGKRPYRQIMHEDLFRPLGMHDSWLGRRADREARRVPIVVRDRRPGLLPPQLLEAHNELLHEGSEMPGVGVFSTASDFHRFAEVLRAGGILDGQRILSPLTVELASTNFTGEKVNDLWTVAREDRGWPEFPAFLSPGFTLRGTGIFPHPFGTLASARTFGQIGAGSTLFWVDPLRDVTFVALTAGLLEESYSVERWQRLSDIALSSVVVC